MSTKELNLETKSKDTLEIDDTEPRSLRSTATLVDGGKLHRKTVHRSRKPQARITRILQPTYRLEAKNPFNRFKGEEIMESMFLDVLQKFIYTPKAAINMAKGLSQEIKYRLIMSNFDRYRFVCVVTIGERFAQSFCNRTKALWDAQLDGYANYVYDNPNFYAIGTIYAIYYE